MRFSFRKSAPILGIFLLLNSVLILFNNFTSPEFPSSFGVYYWGGQPSENILNTSKVQTTLNQMTADGLQSIRINMSQAALSSYGITATQCANQSYLKCLVETTEFGSLISASQFEKVFITAYDKTSAAQNNFLKNSFMEIVANKDAVKNEYKDFAYALILLLQNAPNKKIIIANWEGDNQIYCGASYSYGLDSRFRNACDNSNSTAGYGSIDNMFSAFTAWSMAKKEGIVLAKQMAASQNLAYVDIQLGIEGNSLHALFDNGGYKSVFRNVIPVVQPDVVLYSSYESINEAYRRRNISGYMNSEIDLLKSIVGTKIPVSIGEYGFSTTNFGDDAAYASTELVKALVSMQNTGKIQDIIAWEYWENPFIADRGYGFYSADGTVSAILNGLKSFMFSGINNLSPGTFIKTLVDQGNNNSLIQNVVLNGAFSKIISSVDTDCGINPQVVYQDGFQVNLRFDAIVADKNCRFRFNSAAGVGDFSHEIFQIQRHSSLKISGVSAGTLQSNLINYSLYGAFLTSIQPSLTTNCAGLNPSIVFKNQNQINFQFATALADRNCIFTLSADGLTSSSSSILIKGSMHISSVREAAASPLKKNFELYGRFAPAQGIVSLSGCAGTIEILHWSETQINLSLSKSTSARSCQFQAKSGASLISNLSEFIPISADMTITLARETTASPLKRNFELFGNFVSAQGTATLNSACAGSVEILYWSPTQVNVSLSKSINVRSCQFQLNSSSLLSNFSQTLTVPADMTINLARESAPSPLKRNFELFGNFVSAQGTATLNSACAGSVEILYWSPTQVNVSLSKSIDIRSCQFQLNSSSLLSNFSQLLTVPADMTINLARETTASPLKRNFELFGNFSSAQGIAILSDCVGTIEVIYWAPTQVNVAVTKSLSPRICKFQVKTGTSLISNFSQAVAVPAN